MQSADMSRRTFVKAVGAGAGAGAIATDPLDLGSPVGEARGAVVSAIGIAAAGAAVGYLAGEAADAILGDDKDYSGYTGADALHSAVYEGALQLESANERVMTSIQNNISNSQNVALAKGKAEAIKKMNAGESKSKAETAMESAIDEYYSTIQKNLLTHWDAQLGQTLHYANSVVNHDSLSETTVFRDYSGNDNGVKNIQAGDPASVTLLNGESASYTFPEFEHGGNGNQYHTDPLGQSSGYNEEPAGQNLLVAAPDGSSFPAALRIDMIGDGTTDPVENGRPWNALIWERDDVYQALTGFVSDVYNNWDVGDIPTEELVDPITAATELEQNYDGMQSQGAQAAILGIPTSAEQSLYLHLLNDDKYVWADIYTKHVPTKNGSEVGFHVGETYSPGTWDDPLYIAYEFTDEDGNESSDFVQVTQDFKVVEGQNDDGEEIDKFETRSRNTQTADVSKLKEELEQIRELQLDMQEEAQSGGGGGGGGFKVGDFSVGPVPGIAVVGGIGAAVLAALAR